MQKVKNLPEYIQMSMKNPRQNTIKSDHFFFCESTIASPLVSVSVSVSFVLGKVDWVGPADIVPVLSLSLGSATLLFSLSTIVLVGDSPSGVRAGSARGGTIGSIVVS